jgi:hypothetical protein
LSLALVAHACNPSYSEGSDQEDLSSKPAWANSSWDPISKNPLQKWAGGVAHCIGPEVKPQYHKMAMIIIIMKHNASQYEDSITSCTVNCWLIGDLDNKESSRRG